MVIGESQPHLAKVAGAGNPLGGFASMLDRSQEQPDQDTHDRHNNEQFDERERGQTLEALGAWLIEALSPGKTAAYLSIYIACRWEGK